jgi:hypothetical protein
MTDVTERFGDFFAGFRKTKLWLDMVNTREDSPWHREENTGVHTQMLLKWYTDNLFNSRTENQRMLTMVACLMHDIGKPMAQVVKESPEKGVYRSYGGHEQYSARLWVDFAMSNPNAVEGLLRFDLADVSNIAMMLEYHVPWSMKDMKKRVNLKKAFMQRLGEPGHRAWLDLLLCDQHGRIADEQQKHLAEVDAWMKEWEVL